MRIAYFDCFSGAAGDMILAALLDAGCPADVLHDLVRRLGLSELSIEPQRVTRGGIGCTYLKVLTAGTDGGGATFGTHEHAEQHSHGDSHSHSHSHAHSQAHEHSQTPTSTSPQSPSPADSRGHSHARPGRHDPTARTATPVSPQTPFEAAELPAPRHCSQSSGTLAAQTPGTLADSYTPHRHLPDIIALLRAADLKSTVADRAIAIFQRLAEAEAAVHNVPVDHVHFHEVGAADAIFDICGAVAALDALGIERVVCSPIPTGSGSVMCDHGLMPVPAPATAQLLRGVPLAPCDEPGELTTPTGAAILTTLAAGYGPPPAMTIQSVGYGAGTREGKTRPNFLRVLIGEIVEPQPESWPESWPAATGADVLENDTVTVLAAQLDDATGQVLAHTFERLLAEGALDAYLVPILMKKGRPGHLLTVLARPEDAPRIEQILFAETTTFGVRRTQAARSKLARRHETVDTAFGPIRVKVGSRRGSVKQAWPEYEDCAAAARKRGVALRIVQNAAIVAWTGRQATNSGDVNSGSGELT